MSPLLAHRRRFAGLRRTSIRIRLLGWLSAPFIVISLLGGLATYWLAWVPARDAYDLALADAAWSLATRLHASNQGVAIDLPLQVEQVLRADRFDQIFFAVQDRNGILLTGDRGLPHVAITHNKDQPVFYDGDYGGLPLRLAALPTTAAGEFVVVTVAETLVKRTHGQRKIIATLIAWELALTLAVVTLVWVGTGQGLVPLKRLQDDISLRSLRDLAPLDEAQVPIEVRPLAEAINALLHRIAEAARAQQGFLADIAHQLRTPLAGLITQLAVAKQHSLSSELSNSMTLMQNMADRTVRLANQLLALARAEPTGFHAERLRPLDLADSVHGSVEEWLRLADGKGLDLRFEVEAAPVMGDEFLLRELLDNLVTNAIQYTPSGGRVTVGCGPGDGSGSVVFVEDNGPGIAASQRQKVFERFYRVPGTKGDGSGLGLTIAREIARDHRGNISLSTPASGAGTRVEVRFPPRSTLET